MMILCINIDAHVILSASVDGRWCFCDDVVFEWLLQYWGGRFIRSYSLSNEDGMINDLRTALNPFEDLKKKKHEYRSRFVGNRVGIKLCWLFANEIDEIVAWRICFGFWKESAFVRQCPSAPIFHNKHKLLWNNGTRQAKPFTSTYCGAANGVASGEWFSLPKNTEPNR